MKPRKRVVTAEDVQSSLYYFHVQQGNEELPQNPRTEFAIPKENESVIDRNLSLRRKPVGLLRGNTASISQLRESTSRGTSGSNIPMRKPVGSLSSKIQPEMHSSALNQMSPLSIRSLTASNISPVIKDDKDGHSSNQLENMRPLSTKHMSSHQTIKSPPNCANDEIKSLATDLERLNSTNSIRRKRVPSTQLYGSMSSKSTVTNLTNETETTTDGSESEIRDVKSKTDSDLLITVIRRDPSSGAQWNVGRIIDPPAIDVSSESTSFTGRSAIRRATDGPLFVEVYNPGYDKFISNASSDFKSANGQKSSYESSYEQSPAKTFKRRIWAEVSRLSDNGKGSRTSVTPMIAVVCHTKVPS